MRKYTCGLYAGCVCVCSCTRWAYMFILCCLSLSEWVSWTNALVRGKERAWISAAPLADWLWVLPTQCHFSHFTQNEQNNTFRSTLISRKCKICFVLQHLGNLLYHMSMMNAKISSYRYIIVPGSFSDKTYLGIKPQLNFSSTHL